MYGSDEPLATGYALGRDSGSEGGFGGNGAWWVVIILAVLFGWGRNGLGGTNTGYDLGKTATTNDVASGFANSSILNGLNDLRLGQANGFAGVEKSIGDLSYRQQLGFCEINRNIDSVKFENSKNTCDIINNANANTQKLLDYLTQNEITSLRTQLQSAQFQLSQLSQTASIVSQLKTTSTTTTS